MDFGFLELMAAIAIFLAPQDTSTIQMRPFPEGSKEPYEELVLTYRKSTNGWCLDYENLTKGSCLVVTDGKLMAADGKVFFDIKANLKSVQGTNYVLKLPDDSNNPFGFFVHGGEGERIFEIKNKEKTVREWKVTMSKSNEREAMNGTQSFRSETNRTSSAADFQYDKERYDKMQRVIAGSRNKLVGISLPEASNLLSLDDAKWNEGYTSVPLGQLRIYHFRGFYLSLNLQVLPRGISPEDPKSFEIDSKLHRNGIWWVANFYPALHIDGLDDPQKRMSNYWDEVQAGSKQRTKEMRKLQLERDK